jgi:hypothetical protein
MFYGCLKLDSIKPHNVDDVFGSIGFGGEASVLWCCRWNPCLASLLSLSHPPGSLMFSSYTYILRKKVP